MAVTRADGAGSLRSELGIQIEERADELAREWLEALLRSLHMRPQQVFPGDDLLNDMPTVIRWIGRSVRGGVDLDPATAEALRELAAYRWQAGLPVEEILLHFRILGEILFVTLEGEAVSESASAPAALDASRRLADAVGMLGAVVVGAYRDFEDDRMTRFGQMLAHEIRSPLSAALTGVQALSLLDGGSGGADRERLVERVEHALKRVDGVVSSVRAMAMDRGTPDREWDLEPLAELVSSVLEAVEGDLCADISLEAQDPLPTIPVPAEPVRLVIHNLVENAVKYVDRDSGEGWVRVRCERVEEPAGWRIEVADNGPGIPEAEQHRIFERFYRRSQSGGADGYGLGLSIARQAARQVGGRLVVDSTPGFGTVFTLVLPDARTTDG